MGDLARKESFGDEGGIEPVTGRNRELGLLEAALDRARRGGPGGRPGRAVLMRGGRGVGKTRLAEEFVKRARVPYVFFRAEKQATAEADIGLFVRAIGDSLLPGACQVTGARAATWPAAFRLLATAIGNEQSTIVIIDEMPHLVRNDSGFEGALQRTFDRELSRRPVLLLGIGSDVAAMKALNSYSRPFYLRATEMVIRPLGRPGP